MKAWYLIGAALEMIVKVVILAAVVVFVFRGATQAYEFGYKVFADEPVSISGGRTITVGISENMSVKDVAQMLEEKGLIADANLFIVQELLSAYHDEITPGIYDLSTAMTAQEMLAAMSAPAKEDEEAEAAFSPEPEAEAETEPDEGVESEAEPEAEADAEP